MLYEIYKVIQHFVLPAARRKRMLPNDFLYCNTCHMTVPTFSRTVKEPVLCRNNDTGEILDGHYVTKRCMFCNRIVKYIPIEEEKNE